MTSTCGNWMLSLCRKAWARVWLSISVEASAWLGPPLLISTTQTRACLSGLERRISGNVTVIEMIGVAREDDFRLGRGATLDIGRTKRNEKFIWNPCFGDMKQDCIAGLRVIVNVVRRRFRGISLQIEVVSVIGNCSLQRKQE